MAPYPLNNGTALNSHEERIQRLEEEGQEMATSIARYGEQLKFLAEKIEELPTNIENKILPSLKAIEDHSEKLEILNTSVGNLITDKKSRQKRWGLVSKVIMSGLLAASGAVGVKLVELLGK